ncbi:uncharacterized protein [Henckelia pumila]|uniref:uncharacterized protein n=1 Tax=Henckelia pumila TaxID=405737 RepID=UPI003C6DEE67
MPRFMRVGPKPLARGETPEATEDCLEMMEHFFREFCFTDEEKMETLGFLLEGRARKWWRSTSAPFVAARGTTTCTKFCTDFQRLYFTPALHQAKASELLGQRQETMTIEEYQQKFFDLLSYCPHIAESSLAKYDNFLQVLNPEIHQMVAVGSDMTYKGLVDCCHQGQVFALDQEQAETDSDRMIAEVMLLVSTPMGSEVLAKRLVVDCSLDFEGEIVDCYQCFVQFCPEDGEAWYFYGEGARPLMPVASALKARRALESGGEGYLIYAIDASLEGPGIQEIPVVLEFPDVFPKKIPSLPPVREIEFGIELVPGTAPISRDPYRLAPTEMRELQKQL